MNYDMFLHNFLEDVKKTGQLDEDLELCPECGEVLYPMYENNGYDGVEGPTHEEIVGMECKSCNYKETV